MENLPDEILSDIFTRLLAKQLAQMRMVCKSWNVLLSKPSFKKSHLQRSIHNNNGILLFLHTQSSSHYRSITARLTRAPDIEPPELTNFINFLENARHNVIGCVNGLICFCRGKSPWPSRKYDICILNPSLSVALTLPPCSFPSDYANNDLRFGFDPKTNDYKVFNLVSGYNLVPQAEVYSTRKGSWESISQRVIPSHTTRHRGENTFLIHWHHGHIHWLCDIDMKWKQQTITAFDLSAETFSDISLPNSILDYNVNRTNVLGVLKGKLCVISCVEDGECEVWVMDDYGVADSWAKHHAFNKLSGDIVPHGFTSHGELLFKVGKYDNDFTLYDPVEAKAKNFKITSRFVILKIIEYVDSLFWVAPSMQE